jgi:RHS repeat-associated protein
VLTVPLAPDGSITLHTAGSAGIRVAVTGYWKIPTGTDTGLGLNLLDAPTRLVDTTTGAGTCDGSPCGMLRAMDPVDVEATGQGGLSGDINAVMVSVTAIDQTAAGVVGVGTQEGEPDGGIVVFDPAQHASTTMIIPLTDTGTFTIGSWTQTDVAVDVIGVFRAPTRTWRYEYDTTGMRTAKQLDNTTGTGAEWRKEFSWMMVGGRPLLLAEHQGSQTALVIHGPGGVPIYQINTTGDVQYLHQDHQGSIRLTTNPNGTTRNTITYETTGQISGNTNWWLEQPLIGFASLQHDPETGYIYLRARHYDPTTGQFTTVDPLVAITEEPYGYASGNPVNVSDLTGLWPWDGYCIDIRSDNCESPKDDFVAAAEADGQKSICLSGQIYFAFGGGADFCIDYNSGEGWRSARPSVAVGGGVGSPSLGLGGSFSAHSNECEANSDLAGLSSFIGGSAGWVGGEYSEGTTDDERVESVTFTVAKSCRFQDLVRGACSVDVVGGLPVE